MTREKSDADHGLTPREWLDSDPVPLTPDVDFDDPEQRIAWIRANNEENAARWAELQARRAGAGRGGGAEGDASGRDGRVGSGAAARMSSTTVVGIRLLNAEQRALVRLARRRGLSVSDLVRRWVRAGLDEANGTDLADAGTDGAERDALERDEVSRRVALGDAADAIVERITDEVRRLREVVVAEG